MTPILGAAAVSAVWFALAGYLIATLGWVNGGVAAVLLLIVGAFCLVAWVHFDLRGGPGP